MNMHVRELQDHRVLIGDVMLHFSEYKINGSCLLHEQGTATGDAAVTACFPKGTRITLKGRLAPSTDTAAAVAAVDMVLRSGVKRYLYLGKLICPDARLISYVINEGADFPELTLLFYSSSPLQREANV